MTTPSASPSRLPTLEMLRGAASVAVVFHHIAQQTQGNALEGSAWGRLLLWLGGWGVMVFFVLSGFCIHGSVLRGARPGCLVPGWRNYFIRRARRILPGYLAALALSVVLGFYGGSNLIGRARWIDVWTHLTFTSSFSQDTALRLNSVLWTVVVEAHFYFAYPVFIWARNRLGLPGLTLLLIAVSLGIKSGGRWWLDEGSRWTWHHAFVNLWWIWSLGALLAEKHAGWSTCPRSPRLFTLRWPGLLVIAGSLVVGCYDARATPLAWHVVETFGMPLFAAAVVAAVVFSPLAQCRSRMAEHLGTVSYSMYLFHPAALWLVVHWMPASFQPVTVGAMLALSYLLALSGYWMVERPFLHGRR